MYIQSIYPFFSFFSSIGSHQLPHRTFLLNQQNLKTIIFQKNRMRRLVDRFQKLFLSQNY